MSNNYNDVRVPHASEDNARKLYALSGWDGDDYWAKEKDYKNPHYSSGYLLRKLPKWIEPEKKKPHLLTVQPNPIGKGWNALYRLAVKTPTTDVRHSTHIQEADTPEDALCLLAIKLFEEGVLK